MITNNLLRTIFNCRFSADLANLYHFFPFDKLNFYINLLFVIIFRYGIYSKLSLLKNDFVVVVSSESILMSNCFLLLFPI